MKTVSKQFVSTCVILMPLVSALMVLPPTKVFSKLPNNKAGVKRPSSSALNFCNPNMDNMDNYQSRYKGNRFQHKPARPLSTPPLGLSSRTGAASSPDNSEYGTHNVYWSDPNSFPQEVVDLQAMPPMPDMRNSPMVNNNSHIMNDERIYFPDKYYGYQNNPIPSSSSSFQDIPFQSNENYAKKFHMNAEREIQRPGGVNEYDMNGEFGNRPMGQLHPSPDTMRPGEEMSMGGQGSYYGMQSDFHSPMNEATPQAGGTMQSMADPYSYGQGYGGYYDQYGGYYDQYGGMGSMGGGGMMEPGMGGGGMMGMGVGGMDMPQGEWGFQEMGMSPGGEQWSYQEWGYGTPPPGGEFYCEGQQQQQQEWGMPPGGQPFGGEPFGGGPGGAW